MLLLKYIQQKKEEKRNLVKAKMVESAGERVLIKSQLNVLSTSACCEAKSGCKNLEKPQMLKNSYNCTITTQS